MIDESLDIMRRALRANDPESWLGGDDSALTAAVDRAWFGAQPLPALQARLSRHTLPLFGRAIVQLPAWRPGEAVTRCPG